MTLEQLERLSPGNWFHDVRDQLKWHIYRRSERAMDLGDAARDALATVDDVRTRQAAIRSHLLDCIGGLPEGGDLGARTVGTIEEERFTIERLIYQSRPRHYVTANLYVPHGIAAPTGAVLFLCGHAAAGKAYPEYQCVCRRLAIAGLVVLAQDPIGQGERLSYWEPSLGGTTIGACCPEHDHAGAQCAALGDDIARYFLHDAIRSIDYLCSRPEVDPARIGVTGNSGGGTQSSLVMMAEPRIAAAAPGTFIMNRRTYMHCGGAQDAEQIWPGFSEAGFDHEDILIAMAPRPVRVLAVTDDFFPIEGTRATVARCKRVWGIFGAEQDVDLIEDRSGHAYTPPLAHASAEFFARHLLDRTEPLERAEVEAIDERRLWCTASGQVRGDFPDAESAFESNVARLVDAEEARYSVESEPRREEALRWLRSEVLRARTPCELNPRSYLRDRVGDLLVDARIWWSQPDLLGHGLWFRSYDRAGETLPVTIGVWDQGANCLRPHLDWLRAACDDGRAVLVLDVAGMGALAPHSLLADTQPREFYGVVHKLADDLTWLGDNLAALRTYDVLRALDVIDAADDVDASDTRVYVCGGPGRQGLYGILAAALDERIRGIDLGLALPDFRDWVAARHYDSHNVKSVILRGMLRHFDLSDLASA